MEVPLLDLYAGEVLDAIATSTHAFHAQHHSTTESALASDARHHLAAESALASDVQHHLATESALASDTQQHPATVTTTAPAQEAVRPELHHLRGDDAAGSFLAATVKRAEDAITDEYDSRRPRRSTHWTWQVESKLADHDLALHELEKIAEFSPQL
ncbi:hypothetical protein TRIUR3_01028 [Triticum urartu]|uniref:Uncharacterized protein n=1 Tax=Triticum urartu TaxID=4572 RepID=M8AH64_TRIUA|nr:hypothetical protein TRIUR3_01028 [Triticum urartu]